MKNVSKRLTAIAACIGIAAGSTAALSHGGATGIVKERMDLMDSIAKSMKSLSEMFRGNSSYDADAVRDEASRIAAHGGETMTRLFPEDSNKAPSEALSSVWNNWEGFSALAAQLTTYAEALAEAADNPRTMPGGGGMMGGNMMGGNMMGSAGGPTREMLAQMPPDAAFMHLADTCAACHQDFRKPQ
jgi:cytochrome c556